MPLADLTDAKAVLRAMAEYEKLGREAFLSKHGYRPARSYYLVHNGRSYDSKAIAGVALAIQHPDRRPLRGRDFTGGDATVRKKLEQLGFQVQVYADEASGTRSPRSTPELPASRNEATPQLASRVIFPRISGRG